MNAEPPESSHLEQHNRTQRHYFSSTPKPRMVPSRTPYVERQVDALVEFTSLEPGQRILDMGCGMGRYTLPLAERGLAVEGLDLTPELLEDLRRRNGTGREIPLYCGDMLDLAAELEGQFHAVVGFFTLHHLHDLPLCFQAMRRMLRPGGRITFLEPNAWCPLYYLQVATAKHMRWEGERGILKMRRGPVFSAMEGAGLVRARLERFGFAPPVVANRPWGRRVEGLLEALPPLAPVRAFQLFGAEAPA